MDKLIIEGGIKLKGDVQISGAKNAVLPIMAATLLTEEPCVIHNVPSLSDVFTMIKILEGLGKEVLFEDKTLTVKHISSDEVEAPYELVKTMRASVCVLGPLLAARKTAKVSMPGGCVIGLRPIDLHLKGLEALGAQIEIDGGYCNATISKTRLEGAEIYLGGAFGSSVLATDNVMMAAALASGTTIIDFAACEPEVADLANVLKKMGVRIDGAGTPQLTIQGKNKLSGFEHSVIPDRIEAGSFIVFALATKGELRLTNVIAQHLGAVIDVVRSMGHKVVVDGKCLEVSYNENAKPVNITTLPFPGFPTDLQAQFMALLTQANGVSVITEKVYPDRFMHVAELNRMGAGIFRSGEVGIVSGAKKLSGAEVMASDLRASACLVAAGLAAKGKTTIHRLYHLDRGYENFDTKLRAVGARLTREKE